MGYQTPLQTPLLPWRRTRCASSSSRGEPRVLLCRKVTSSTETCEHGLAGRLCVLQRGMRIESIYTYMLLPANHPRHCSWPLCACCCSHAAGCFGTGVLSSHGYRRACLRCLGANKLNVSLLCCLGVSPAHPSHHAGKEREKAEALLGPSTSCMWLM